MKRYVLPAGAALAALVPATAAAKPPTSAHAHEYEHAYREAVHLFGRRAPGRNIVKDGFAPQRPATDAETVASLAVLDRMIASATTPSTAASSAPVSSSSGSSSSSGGGLPACASESGTNYSTGASNTNSSSGATGRYQITPSTAAN